MLNVLGTERKQYLLPQLSGSRHSEQMRKASRFTVTSKVGTPGSRVLRVLIRTREEDETRTAPRFPLLMKRLEVQSPKKYLKIP